MKQIKSLSLINFRLHQSLSLKFSTTTTLIIGPNASGKTAIVEAIFLTSRGNSFRANKIEEMIQFGQETGRVRLKLEERPQTMNHQTTNSEDDKIKKGDREILDLGVLLTRGTVQGRKTQYRLFDINQVSKRKKNFIGQFQIILFRPEDMRLIEGSPARRRQFLDQILTQLFYDYDESLKIYENTLRRRNKLLISVREGEQSRNVLQFWNLSLIKHGQILQAHRQQFLEHFIQVKFPVEYQMHYLPSVISEKRLVQYLDREIAAGHSLIGPHKDDFQVLFQPKKPMVQSQFSSSSFHFQLSNGKFILPPELDVAVYGSRGQQRLAVLWLKAGESQYLEDQTQGKVIWLLDDILSELDKKGRAMVLSLIDGRQTIITSADEHIEKLIKTKKIIRLNA